MNRQNGWLRSRSTADPVPLGALGSFPELQSKAGRPLKEGSTPTAAEAVAQAFHRKRVCAHRPCQNFLAQLPLHLIYASEHADKSISKLCLHPKKIRFLISGRYHFQRVSGSVSSFPEWG